MTSPARRRRRSRRRLQQSGIVEEEQIFSGPLVTNAMIYVLIATMRHMPSAVGRQDILDPMTDRCPMASAGGNKRSFVFYLVPEFSMIAFSMAIEPLRLANRMLGMEYYSWRLASADGGPVSASNGVRISADCSLSEERTKLSGRDRPDMVIVCSGVNVEKFENKTVLAWLREEHNRGVAIGGLCTGAHILALAGLLSGRRCAIHWENIPGFAERFPKAEAFADLFEIDGNIHTCAGGTAARHADCA